MIAGWPWIVVALLGAYHGLDPSMGWLFAVALGMQERRRSKVVWALVPIALGHLASIAVVVALVGGLRLVGPLEAYLRPAGALVLVLFGVFRFLWPRVHPRWVAMRVNSLELGFWSFLMASAHGAGLMLFPMLMDVMPKTALAMHPGGHMPIIAHTAFEGLAVLAVHTAAMLFVMGTIALLVYERFGLAILKSAWVNLDFVWNGALIAAGIMSFFV